ncbi:MAG: acyl carrier protein [Chloroflexi bacterium]|nr:acyl carrier protein [Chloroflexota bacterium]
MNVYEEVKKAIRKVAPGLDESKVVSAALLKEDLELDSLDRVELTLELENTLGFYLLDEELVNITTVGEIVSLIEEKSKERAA